MPLDLNRPRDLSALFNTTFQLYGRHFWTFAALALAVVVPVNFIADGLGVGQLSSGYDASPPVAATAVSGLAAAFVSTPLITAMHVHVVMEIADGRAPDVRRSFRHGLDVFAPVLGAILLATLGIAVGFLLLIVPGIILAIRWYFVAQSVVVEGDRGTDALRRSASLVEGTWWRVLGIVVLFNLIIQFPAGIASYGVDALAKSADSGAVVLVGGMIVQTATLSFVALTGTLLFFDLRARKALGADIGRYTSQPPEHFERPMGLDHPERPPGLPDPPDPQ